MVPLDVMKQLSICLHSKLLSPPSIAASFRSRFPILLQTQETITDTFCKLCMTTFKYSYITLSTSHFVNSHLFGQCCQGGNHHKMGIDKVGSWQGGNWQSGSWWSGKIPSHLMQWFRVYPLSAQGSNKAWIFPSKCNNTWIEFNFIAHEHLPESSQ